MPARGVVLFLSDGLTLAVNKVDGAKLRTNGNEREKKGDRLRIEVR